MAKAVWLKQGGEKYYPAPYWPIGSIYISTNNTNPSNYFGGTWEALPQDYYLITAPITRTQIGTGGSWYTENTILTINQIPPHQHTISNNGNTTLPITINAVSNAGTGYSIQYKYGSAPNPKILADYTGGGKGHNHKYQPPYYQVYAWKRIA